MSKLYVNEIFPQSGTTVKISGSLEFQEDESLVVLGAEGAAATITLKADQGDDSSDVASISVADGGAVTIDATGDTSFPTGSVVVSAGLVYTMGVANAQTITTITIPANYNAVLYGPITIDDDQDITIGDNSHVKIIDIDDTNF